MNSKASKLATLMGTASLFTMANALSVQAQQVAQTQTAQAQTAQSAGEQIPEQVLVTGSLIHGAAAVGVPVTNLSAQDFTETGNVTIGDLFRTVPSANVAPGPSAVNSGGHQERETRVNIRGLDQTGPRTLLMVDGVRFPPQADGICAVDPSIIPALALDRVDILADGASATYGSDAIAGVINVVLKRGFDGAVTLLHFQAPDSGGLQYQASQLYGRTWDGGDITVTYEWTDEGPVYGNAHSKYTMNYTPWGLDNPIPLGSSIPGTISVGAPSSSNIACTNCWAIPHGAGANFPGGLGPTLPSSAATLNWAVFSANAANRGTQNVIDPLKQAWELGAQQKNSFTATFDQRLFPGISFFATGFYANRRVQELAPADYSQGVTNDIKTFVVPTTNPYYPTNAPANLRVSYDFAHEIPPTIPAYELSYRYQFGLNLDLPFGWNGQIFDSRSYEANQYTLNIVNDNAVNVALGTPTGGVTKPAGVPYLNLFCDVTQFKCNSPASLSYIMAQRVLGDKYTIEEKGARFDGPLFDLPAGQVKAAIGGTFESDNVLGFTGNNSGSPAGTPLSIINDSEPYQVWAGYAQVQIPITSDSFNIPLVRKFDLELSWRHDQYTGTLHGGTSNPKVAFNWMLSQDLGATVRGSWGTSFRFANAGEYSTVLSDANGAFNFPSQGIINLPCTGGAPTPGSAAAALFQAGFACGSTPGGIGWAGGPHPELRSYIDASTGQPTSREGGTALAPEKSINYSVGFELAPQMEFLRGLDVQATWYSVKVNGTLLGFNNTTGQTLSDPLQRFHVIVPSDLGCPVAANANPTTCAPFEKMVQAAILDRNSTIDLSALPSVFWLSDGSTVGTGFLKVDGIDWNASYTWDMGDLGAWNTGITGTYYLHRYNATINGGTVVDLFHQNIQGAGGIAQNGVETLPRMIYRARLGWSNGPYTVTGFVNYISHYYSTWPVPPNVNFQCTAAGGSTGGGTFPCAINNWSNIEPSWYTFDLSFGYNTGDMPANNYLKDITVQLTIQNLMGIHSPFEYGPSTSTRNISGYDILKPDTGRVIGITLLKNW
ncbi:MAG TPA: TonB-dependent receptor [Micropepsaceae bacterium]|nr:TonB-dependent receptor [Micropepsaceae bacterium]